MRSDFERNLVDVLENGNPDDVDAAPNEKLFVRAMRREMEREKGNRGYPDQNTFDPVTMAELERARRILGASGYADLVKLLQSALEEHQENHGVPHDNHWSAKASEIIERPASERYKLPKQGRTNAKPARNIARPTLDEGAIAMLFAFGLLLILSIIAGLRYS